jgi:hypothetical protein
MRAGPSSAAVGKGKKLVTRTLGSIVAKSNILIPAMKLVTISLPATNSGRALSASRKSVGSPEEPGIKTRRPAITDPSIVFQSIQLVIFLGRR